MSHTHSQGWMDKYFERIQSLTTNPDLPRRIHFMLLDVLELRANKVSLLPWVSLSLPCCRERMCAFHLQWQPRRSFSQQGPRPLHEIRQEVYQQDKPTPSTLPPMHQPAFRGHSSLHTITQTLFISNLPPRSPIRPPARSPGGRGVCLCPLGQ